MKISLVPVPQAQLSDNLVDWLHVEDRRLGLISSLDGGQLVTLVLDCTDASAQCWLTPLDSDVYHSLTPSVPQAHWFERALNDLFGIRAAGHPRLKSVLQQSSCKGNLHPLRSIAQCGNPDHGHKSDNSYLHVSGEGVYEIPVGPVHAGIIEPGHFRLNCLGETIINLEIRLGFLHRGVERRLTEIPWRSARFVAEAASSDAAAACAIAHAIAVESMSDITVPERAQYLRTLALEVERVSMHINDLGGMSVDLGWSWLAANLSRLRGMTQEMAALLSGSRFLRNFICPGGVSVDPDARLGELKRMSEVVSKQLEVPINAFFDNSSVHDRTVKVGEISRSAARELGLVGVAARGSGIAYDARQHFAHGLYPALAPAMAVETAGDVLSRLKVRSAEIVGSLDLIRTALDNITSGTTSSELPNKLPGDTIGVGIVEAFRGELIHLIFTDKHGAIKRYCIKDPSFNNWTALAIAAGGNLVADFPVCNKSFSLSYSGVDL